MIAGRLILYCQRPVTKVVIVVVIVVAVVMTLSSLSSKGALWLPGLIDHRGRSNDIRGTRQQTTVARSLTVAECQVVRRIERRVFFYCASSL